MIDLLESLPDLKGGLCRNYDPEIWQSRDPELMEKAQWICADCPVRVVCAQWAMDYGESEGVWGGLTPEDRHMCSTSGCRLSPVSESGKCKAHQRRTTKTPCSEEGCNRLKASGKYCNTHAKRVYRKKKQDPAYTPRKQVAPIEYMVELVDQGHTADVVAERAGISRDYVYRAMTVRGLHDKVIQLKKQTPRRAK